MKRCLLLGVVAAAMATVAALALQNNPPLLVTTWAGNAPGEGPTAAVLIELGVNDPNVRDWSGQAVVSGAKVVKREGYRFQTGDKLLKGDAWKISSHRAIRAPKGQPGVSKMVPIASVGIVLHVKGMKEDARLTVTLDDKETAKAEVSLKEVLAGKVAKLWNGAAEVRLVTTATPLVTAKTEDDFPAACYGPDGTLWVAYISYTVREDSRRIEAPNLKKQPDNFKTFFTPEPGEQLFVKHYRAGKWSQPLAVTPPSQDLARCAIAADKGAVWVVYSARRDNNFDLYGRSITCRSEGPKQPLECTLGKEERLTTAAGSDITPVMCTDQNGVVWSACQTWGDDGQARITVLRHLGKGAPQRVVIEAKKGENCWHPAIAAAANGDVAVAYDIYRDGDYDVAVAIYNGKTGKRRDHVIAASRKGEMRPSIAYRDDGLWIAYEEGPEKWGKDYGAQSSAPGNPLYNERSVRVVHLHDDGSLTRPAELPTSSYDPPRLPFDALKTNKYERTTRYAYPKLGIDLKGRLWLAYRQNFGSRYSSHPGAYWLSFVRRLEDRAWSPPIEVNHSDGLLDYRPVLLPHKSGGLVIVHNTDGRYTTPEVIDNQIYVSTINLPGEVGTPQEVDHKVPARRPSAEAAAERDAIDKIRAYRLDCTTKKLQILRGEYHRHTEISWDGGADGSLEDMFRYAIDVAGMDWIGNGDHDNGAGREYPWWLTQKYNDAYHTARRFTPMFTYERSVPYPHGHRNCMFARRGVRTLPRLAPTKPKAEGGVHPDDTKMLYRYLRELDGICAVHTSATGMGTDWRDNDPKVEPIVEIYQGDRMSYEMEGAPRAGYDPQTDRLPANIAGWYPKGFVNKALGMGYRLGFQASSDHWSTHISYFMVLAERNDRESILDAVKRRHTYGATDNIIVDLRSGPYIQGDSFDTRQAPTLSINVIGANDLAKIDVIRDSKVVATLQPQGQCYQTTWTDPQPAAGTHYYYIRVLQRDNEIAWASPLWVNLVK